jgi:DNA-binding transcriptional ArsR family regulator
MISHLYRCEIIPTREVLPMEATAYLFRALANHQRIQILRVLVVLGERGVAQMCEALGAHVDPVSRHLRLLAAAGLVWRRRSGRVVYYRLPETPRNPLTGAVIAFLHSAFQHIRTRDARRVARSSRGASLARSDARLFAYFTAFTHSRRLQIIRYLYEHGTAPMGVLPDQLGMSPQACWRHVSKLCRRGIAASERAGRATLCSLLDDQDLERQAVTGAVLASIMGR